MNYNTIKNILLVWFKNTYTISTLIFISVIIFFNSLQIFTWNVSVLITLISIVLFLLCINIIIPRNNMNLTKLVISFIIIFFVGVYFSYSSIIRAYNNAEKIDEIIPLTEDIKIYTNDNNKLFILFVEGIKNPFLLYFDDLKSYMIAKNKYEKKEITIEKKHVKFWYKDTVSVGYYLEGKKFK